jgi:hypothetical protein
MDGNTGEKVAINIVPTANPSAMPVRVAKKFILEPDLSIILKVFLRSRTQCTQMFKRT